MRRLLENIELLLSSQVQTSHLTSGHFLCSLLPPPLQPTYYSDELSRRNYDTYRMYSKAAPHGGYHDDSYLDEVVTFPPAADYGAQPHGLKSTTNYVDFYASLRRPSYRAEPYPGSPDSWV